MTDNGKRLKLFNWRQGVIMALVATAAIGVNAYRTHEEKGVLDITWFVISGITLAFMGAIVFFVVRYANKSEEEN